MRDPRLELARVEHSIFWLERQARNGVDREQLVALLERRAELRRELNLDLEEVYGR